MPGPKVLVVDDFKPWRLLVRKLLQVDPRWSVSEASDGEEAVRRAAELQPEFAVLDIGIPKLNGLEAARRIRQTCPESKMVFLTQDRDEELREAALAIAGTRFVLKANAGTELMEAIRDVVDGHGPRGE